MSVANIQHDAGNALDLEEISSILFRLSQELKDLDGEVGKVEEIVSEIPIQSVEFRKKIILGLQNFDHVRQVLGELAKFVDGLGVRSEATWQLSSRVATEAITLSALASRLQGLHGSPAPAATNIDQDCCLFDEDD
jgi:hypothetical protein